VPLQNVTAIQNSMFSVHGSSFHLPRCMDNTHFPARQFVNAISGFTFFAMKSPYGSTRRFFTPPAPPLFGEVRLAFPRLVPVPCHTGLHRVHPRRAHFHQAIAPQRFRHAEVMQKNNDLSPMRMLVASVVTTAFEFALRTCVVPVKAAAERLASARNIVVIRGIITRPLSPCHIQAAIITQRYTALK
jgi:hypothetical protein